jgi:hypothetical protein
MNFKLFASLTALLLTNMMNAQTAVNFNCRDCDDLTHDLFTELDTGSVIVLCWVMPCSGCVPTSLTTYNVVESFKEQSPRKVFMYLCDDFADTPCSSLKSWANSNALNNSIKFSNNSIKMSDYGGTGMPKVVVLGSSDHKVYYNANDVVNPTDLQTAIQTAINESSIGMPSLGSGMNNMQLFPNPAKLSTVLSINSEKKMEVEISAYNLPGLCVKQIFNGELQPGENKIEINSSLWCPGIYFINIRNKQFSKNIKLIVSQ